LQFGTLTREMAMWFCDLRQMPSLRDCVCEFASNMFKWFCDLFGSHDRRRA
jgi:hypothetical protein